MPLPGYRIVRFLAVAGGALLVLIGIRFLLVPADAARSFGLARQIVGHELHYVVGLRDVWLGALAVVLALLKEWRALAAWFALGAVVCFADAAIAYAATARTGPVVFHVASGLACIALSAATARLAARPS